MKTRLRITAKRLPSLLGSVSLCVAIAAAHHFTCSPVSAGKYTPESPHVQEVIGKAMTFLEQPQTEERLGGICLMGMAFHKAGYEASHFRIVEAVTAVQKACKESYKALGDDGVYSIGIAAVFLADLNSTLYKSEIDTLMGWLETTQKPHGGWGYFEKETTGDTSMTQYAVLCLWTAKQAGVEVKPGMIRRVAAWLGRTQAPNGQWGYQGRDPGQNQNRIAQTGKRYSIFAAGAGSTYICADMLGLTSRLKQDAQAIKYDLPPAFVLVDESGKSMQRVNAPADVANLLTRATGDANAWFDKNYNIAPNDKPSFPTYYLYALERYMSFREQADGDDSGHPLWYDDGVDYLTERQRNNGSFYGRIGDTASTSLGALFLLRSTKKSIDKANYGQGLLGGGRGLPKDISNARVLRGKVVSEPLGGKADDVLAILEDPDNPKFENLVDNPGAIALSGNATNQASEIERFRRIVLSSDQALARRLGVKALSQHRDLENVPILIYALTDGDPQVSVGARDGLRFISRKIDGFGMSATPNKQDKIRATVRWKEWYRSIRPDAEFVE